jgi:hypothetical protein
MAEKKLSDSAADAPVSDAAPRPSHRLRLALILAAAAAVLLVVLAPTILSIGPMRDYAMAAAGDELAMTVRADGWSLSWLGRQEVRGVSVTMPDGADVARIDAAALDQGLLGLIVSGDGVGPVSVTGGEVWAGGVARAREAMARRDKEREARQPSPPKPAGPGDPPALPRSVQVSGVVLHADGARVRLAEAALQPASGAAPAVQQFSATWEVEHEGRRGKGAVQGSVEGLRNDWRGWEALGVKADATLTDMPVAAACALAQMFGVPLEGGGDLSASAAVQRSREGAVTVRAQTGGKNVWVTGEPLKGDRLALDVFQADLDAALDKGAVRVGTFTLSSPIATARAGGTFTLATTDAAAADAKGTAELTVQLAPLAKMLPNTLGLQKGLSVTGGHVKADVQAASGAGGASIMLVADVADLAGTRDGKAIALSPAHIEADVRRTPGAAPASSPRAGSPDTTRSAPAAPGGMLAMARGVRLESLKVTGGFGTISGAGTLEALTLDARLDLARASAEAAQFIDMGGISATGLVTVHAQTRGSLDAGPAAQAAPIAATVKMDANNLDVAWSETGRFTEPALSLAADAALARTADGGLASADVKSWTLTASPGRLAGTASAKPGADGWAVSATAQGEGDVAALARTIAQAIGGKPQPIRGKWTLQATGARNAAGDLDADVTAGATDLVIPQTAEEGQPAKPDVRLADVRFKAKAWVGHDGAVRVPEADLTGPGLVAKASGTGRLPQGDAAPFSADATLDVQADLAQVAQTAAPFGLLPVDAVLDGKAAIAGTVKTAGGRMTGTAAVDATDLAVEIPSKKVSVAEPKVRIPVAFTHRDDARAWEFTVGDIESGTVRGTVIATLAGPPETQTLAARAGLSWDGQRLRAALGTLLPPELALSGPWTLQAQADGPLAADGPWNRRIAGLVGKGTLTMNQFKYEQFTGGNGQIDWRMADGRVVFGPEPGKTSRFEVAGGFVNVGGALDLKGDSARLVVEEPLQLVEGVPLEGEQLQAYLRYASPVLAASMNAKGKVFATIEAMDVPLAEGKGSLATAAGRYRIDEFQTVMAGPLGRVLGAAGAQTETPVHPFGPVNVTLADGKFRIAEHDLQYSTNTRLRFGGTIGLDKTMNVVVGVPLTDELLAKQKVSASAMPYLRGQTVSLPLTGTLDEPKLDEKAMGQLIAKAVAEAAKQKAIEVIGDFLKRK